MRRALRKGFTLIELMVVIGIILLLVSITVFGLRHVNAVAARKETFAEMEICRNMLKEYQSVNSLTNIEGTATPGVTQLSIPTTINPQATTNVLVPVYVDTPLTQAGSGATIVGPPNSFISPNDTAGSSSTGDMGDRGGALNSRYTAPAVYNTRAIMYVLLKDSKNRAMLSAIPTKRIMEGPPAADGTGTMMPADYSMVLDGWGNPIIYVPRGGMVVWMAQSGIGSYYIVRSSGINIGKADGTFPLSVPSNLNDQPFFASAGQDGIFSDPQFKTDNGIDNIYSFQQ